MADTRSDEALADARRRAERLADAAGRRLGVIVSIDTGAHTDRPGVEELTSSSAMPVEPGDLMIAATVTVVLALGD